MPLYRVVRYGRPQVADGYNMVRPAWNSPQPLLQEGISLRLRSVHGQRCENGRKRIHDYIKSAGGRSGLLRLELGRGIRSRRTLRAVDDRHLTVRRYRRKYFDVG